MADFFLRFAEVSWSFVVGTSDSRLIFSLRTKQINQNAGQMARRMVKGLGTAGGHGRTAGGQVSIQGIPEEKAVKVRQSIQRRFLKFVGQENAKEEKFLPEFPLRNGIT